MAKDIRIPVTLRGNRIEAKATLGQTVIKTVGPETYTGPVTVTPTDEPQTLQTKDKMLRDNVTVGAIPDEYIIPTGSVEITENGQYDITEKASVTVDVPAPQPTGTKEITISENGEQNVDVSGFAFAHILTSVPVPQGGLEYEVGTYIPETTGVPTIFFANPHTKAPSVIIFNDVSDTASSYSTTEAFVYINPVDLFSAPLLVKADVYYDEYVSHLKKHSNGNVTSGTDKYTRGEVTATAFIPFAATSYDYRIGQTYKWIAIWT